MSSLCEKRGEELFGKMEHLIEEIGRRKTQKGGSSSCAGGDTVSEGETGMLRTRGNHNWGTPAQEK